MDAQPEAKKPQGKPEKNEGAALVKEPRERKQWGNSEKAFPTSKSGF